MWEDLSLQYDKIYRYCYFKVNNPQLAEDLTQETFLRYFRQNTYINRGKTLAYLYTIARNLCIDSYRRPDVQSLESDVPAPGEMDGLETGIALRQAIETLTPECRELVMLRFANELGINEIASVTGMSRFAVQRKLNASLSRLKSILREEDFYE